MSTPLEVRTKRREAQRAVRLALNAINAGLDSWKAAIDDGKKISVAFTNSILTLEHLRTLPLGVLSDIADLRETAARKALKKARSQVIDLRACLTALEAAVQALHEAVAPVSSLAAAEEQESVLKGSPVFTALPLSSIAMLMRRIYDMHEAELKVKRAMVADCEVALTEAQWRHGDSGGLPVGAVSNGKHSIGTSRLKDHESLEAFLQVHIVAWMLCVEVTEKQVEADLAMITQDANSC